MARAGDLAFGGAGRRQADASLEQLLPLVHDYGELIQEWPVAVEPIEIRHVCEGTPGLAGWLQGLRRKEDGGLLKLDLQASQLASRERVWRDEKLVGHWVQHLAANAAGLSMETRVMSPAGEARFRPLDVARASDWLDTLLRAWMEGMCRPLPVKATFAAPIMKAVAPLSAPPSDPQAWESLLAAEKLAAVLDRLQKDDWNQEGRDDAAYESRAYPTRDSLLANGEPVRWAMLLYAPLVTALREKEAA